MAPTQVARALRTYFVWEKECDRPNYTHDFLRSPTRPGLPGVHRRTAARFTGSGLIIEFPPLALLGRNGFGAFDDCVDMCRVLIACQFTSSHTTRGPLRRRCIDVHSGRALRANCRLTELRSGRTDKLRAPTKATPLRAQSAGPCNTGGACLLLARDAVRAYVSRERGAMRASGARA
ncbi:unnamed protein product, partial [Iphiclides podalirius]